jgi:uncharacterized membrane-anchored protein YitT (DUF2179 family)
VSGIAIILYRLIGTPVGTMYLLFNLPLLAAGLRWLGGGRFLWRTLYAVLLFSVVVDNLTGHVPTITTDPLLYTLYGGVMSGVGTGLIFRAYGTSGGSDIVAQLLTRFRGVPVSQALVGFDVLVLALAAFYFGADKALYALIVSFAGSRAIEAVQEGASTTRLVWIVSQAPDRIARHIIQDLARGVTFLTGTGGYTGASYRVIMAVIRPQQLNLLTDLIHEIDPDAFVIIGDARQVLGFGFQPFPTAPSLRRPRLDPDTGSVPAK